MGFETQDVERKCLSILKVLSDCQEPLGARVIAQRLKNYGIELSERAVRYHLKMMDERGFTRLEGRDGRLLTEQGLEEVRKRPRQIQSRVRYLQNRAARLPHGLRFRETPGSDSHQCLLFP